jgi:TfoX N-terminal domain
MAYDEDLADRIRWLIGYDPALTERKMFGGLAFLFRGHLAITASRLGGALVRVNPASTDDLIATTGATVAELGGRPRPGWLHVAAADLADDDRLAEWVQLGTDYARSLPHKKRKLCICPPDPPAAPLHRRPLAPHGPARWAFCATRPAQRALAPLKRPLHPYS